MLRIINSKEISKTAVVTGSKSNKLWRKLHNEYSSQSIIRIIKSRRMKWARHVVQVEKRNANKLLV
jgi:hypothetical protein